MGYKASLTIINSETKEELGQTGTVIYIPSRPAKIYGDHWFMMNQPTLMDLAKDRDLRGNTWRVWAYLCSILSFENWIHVDLKSISDALKIAKPNVSRELKVLINKGLIAKEAQPLTSGGFAICYRLSEKYGWKGKTQNSPQVKGKLLPIKVNQVKPK